MSGKKKVIARAVNPVTGHSEPDWRSVAMEALNALRLFNAHYDDLSKSNPGFLGKLVLQDYGLLNEALIASGNALSKYRNYFK
ncbi:MAG: hypothetical protein ACOYOU_00940 [Kiritimatiellia bacterium]